MEVDTAGQGGAKALPSRIQFSQSMRQEEDAGDTPLVRDHALIPREERKYGAPVQLRPGLSDNYEGEVSGRERWWRKHIRETPLPGAYDVQETDTFLRDIDVKTNTYRFKSDGRKMEPQPQIGKGEYLMPGAYNHVDLADHIEKSNKLTYSFKNTSRASRDAMNFGRKDKDINVPPNLYETAKYMTLTVDKQPSKHSVFKSQAHRFPTIQFVPKEGPSPGNYDHSAHRGTFDNAVKLPKTTCSTSSFKSKTPRFSTSHTKTPGPGTYEKTYKPMSGRIQHMGKHFGLFFSPEYNLLLKNC